MGRMLGAFDDTNDLDRPDLNKCPDCGCYFVQEACPLCGKVCPEEMRAGNRQPVKQPKRRRPSGNGRVTFVEWYHSWWFILLMLVFVPIAGFVLLFTSPHSKAKKLLVVGIAIAVFLVYVFGIFAISELVDWFSWYGEDETLVNTSIGREEYIAKCQEITPEEYYRSTISYTERYLTMTLTVESRIVEDNYDYDGDYKPIVYYLCQEANNPHIKILVRDCRVDEIRNYLPDDQIIVYGEGAGDLNAYNSTAYESYAAPGIYAAYIDMVEE